MKPEDWARLEVALRAEEEAINRAWQEAERTWGHVCLPIDLQGAASSAAEALAGLDQCVMELEGLAQEIGGEG